MVLQEEVTSLLSGAVNSFLALNRNTLPKSVLLKWVLPCESPAALKKGIEMLLDIKSPG